ncbi:uncharacterized protein LOC132741395 [Ruditapes philippinarum]|uniref:uncharacterized protein LOC132741395 n=1 Tax=Ruditapes philippinarum TaxID=129788 RepID=UPI00295BEE5A|nr:uncharacterized protein LOC132741395 [Ruditapes philippinarum]
MKHKSQIPEKIPICSMDLSDKPMSTKGEQSPGFGQDLKSTSDKPALLRPAGLMTPPPTNSNPTPDSDENDETGSVIESYTVLIDDSVNSTSSQEGCTTMKVKRKNGILLAEEYVSDSDCSDVLPIYTAIPLEKPLMADADSTCAETVTKKPKEKTCTEIIIQTVSDSDKRDYSKKQCCFFCQKTYCKMARHLEKSHDNVPEIGRLPSGKNASKEDIKKRKTVFAKYRNLGNFNHNVDVLLRKSGVFFVGRRPLEEKKSTAFDYLPCPYCLLFLVKGELWRHVKTCAFKEDKIEVGNIKDLRRVENDVRSAEYVLKGGLGSEMYSGDQEFNDYVLSRFHVDTVSMAIRSDQLLLLFGNTQFRKLGNQRASQVREKLRILGRLKLELRRLTGKESANIGDFIKSQYFDICLRALANMCGESEKRSTTGSKTYEKPSSVLKAGQLLKKIAALKRGQAVRTLNLTDKEDIDNFLSLYNDEFAETVGSIARHTLTENKYNKQEGHDGPRSLT